MAGGVNHPRLQDEWRVRKLRVRSRPIALVAAWFTSGCGAGGASAPPAAPFAHDGVANNEAAAVADASGFFGKTFGVVRSPRFGVAIALPDREAWTVVDSANLHGGWIVASHGPTGTVLRLRRYDEMSLSGRRECEARARLMGELPSKALAQEKLMVNADGPTSDTVGYWQLKSEKDFYKDRSAHGNHIKVNVQDTHHIDPRTAALEDLCHVLFNANEFFYVD